MILGECDIALAARPLLVAAAAGAATEPEEERVEAHRAAFAVIRRRGRRLHRRIEDMLRVARSESGTIELHFQPVSLRAVCTSAIEAFEGATKRKDVAIVLR